MGDGGPAAREGRRGTKRERRAASRRTNGVSRQRLSRSGGRGMASGVAGIWSKGCEAYSDSVRFLRASGKWVVGRGW